MTPDPEPSGLDVVFAVLYLMTVIGCSVLLATDLFDQLADAMVRR